MSDHARTRFAQLAALAAVCLGGPALAASPAVEAALALPRTQPRHYVETSIALIDLGATDEAQRVAEELVAQNYSDAQLADLVAQVGTAPLSRLAAAAPAASPLVRKALSAADAAATSPERLAGLVSQLAADRDSAIEAIRELRATGSKGAEFAAEQIAVSDDPKVRARLREALVALDPISRPVIYAGTHSDKQTVRDEAAYALGRLGELDRVRSSLPAALVSGAALRGSKPAVWAYSRLADEPLSLESATRLIDNTIEELLSGGRLYTDERDDTPEAGKRLAARLARERWELDERVEASGALAAALLLDVDDPAGPDLAKRVGLSTTLAAALEQGLHLGAIRVATALGRAGDASAVATRGLEAAPLVAALDSRHPAVRYAAAEAIVAIGPTEPYSGSSRLVDTLLHFAAGEGQQRAVVASPQLARAGETAGWLRASGYAATPANRGADAVRLATETPDTQLVLLDASITMPDARETLFRLRRNPATALVPVGLLAAEGRQAAAVQIAGDHEATVAVARPHSIDATKSLAERLAALSPEGWPDASVRQQWAKESRGAIARLVDEGPDFYGWGRHADELVGVLGYGASEQSLTTLARLGTPESQSRLADAASLAAGTIDQRRAAADAFAQSVDRFGVLLTTDQIRQQYDRYNASQNAPETTQRVLGGLLDTIEGGRP